MNVNWDKIWESIYLAERDIYPDMYGNLKQLPENVWKSFYREIICYFEQMKSSVDEFQCDYQEGKLKNESSKQD